MTIPNKEDSELSPIKEEKNINTYQNLSTNKFKKEELYEVKLLVQFPLLQEPKKFIIECDSKPKETIFNLTNPNEPETKESNGLHYILQNI
jgi:hypothetical protein